MLVYYYCQKGGVCMPQGVIAEHKTKTTILMEKQLKADLEVLAKKDNRSFNNLMVTVLTEYVKTRKAEL